MQKRRILQYIEQLKSVLQNNQKRIVQQLILKHFIRNQQKE